IEVCQNADIVFMALHGDFGENGKLQAAFDLMGIRYTGTDSFSASLAMDKAIAKQVFMMNGVNTPPSHLLTGIDDPYRPDYPCVVKICNGGSSIGVFIVHDDAEYKKAVLEAFSYEGRVIVENYIKGREFTDCVIEGRALPIVEIAPKEGFYDYKNKYQAGATVETCPAQISPELTDRIQNQAVAAYKALGIRTYARIDFIVSEDDRVYCLEANTLPGMTPTSLIPQEAAAIGCSFPDLCEWIIRVSLKKYE
ncbi:MAG: D-alanine--D-alanine ligase, partial [Lachnospiraceae bacterium]|nr:D-alanine--D-alanine ligase [Lachnospiraceae bacterium]